ncbi:hypothetical protein GHT06_007011 [Daphnia sinensis]|uniref:Uncharacterized protein n=1 Tax=Daphnia sinensis TaxID=1820382 RepID=A0AAD5KTA1_9CRUS|nr:hypothetical protein GHT06_007011 [Daphnia sinensis]
MKTKGFELVPYVNSINETPDDGITGFIESPRYSTGYAALHNSIGFMPETHMLKSFDKRVESTYLLLQTYVEIVARDAKIIGENKRKADEKVAQQDEFPLDWKLNRSVYDSIEFKGYTAKYKPSEGKKKDIRPTFFEDTAAQLLKSNPALKQKLEEEKLKNPELAKNGRAQLDFVYKNSDYYEKTFNRYPIGRLTNNIKLNLK